MKDISSERYPEWDLLVTWVAVIATGSISQAAERLGMTQAGVSHRVGLLESVLDCALLDRGRRPARPTSAGHRLYDHATLLLQHADQMVVGVRNVSRSKRNTVRLGSVESFAATIGPVIISALAQRSNQLRLVSGNTSGLQSQLEARELDFTVTTGRHTAPGLRKEKLFSEPFLVVLPRSFESGTLSTFTALSRRLQFIRYNAHAVIAQEIEDYLQLHSEHIERTYEFDATDLLLSLVSAGHGFALTTPLCLWQSRQYLPSVRILPLSSFSRDGQPYEEMRRSYYLNFHDNELGSLPSVLQELIRIGYEKLVDTEISKGIGFPKSSIYFPHVKS
ncbi:LysR family transcriptional regulator [Caballeronia calidae]|nr:LysR family transcriptional regulator [Caballeronia calidae]